MSIEITQDQFNEFMAAYDDYMRKQRTLDPKCHFKPMTLEFADNGNGGTVSWWECSVCGHTKEI